MIGFPMDTIKKEIKQAADVNRINKFENKRYAYLTNREKALLIDSIFNELYKDNMPGAALMIIKDGKVLFAKGYGLGDLQEKKPVTIDTQFYLASMSKQFTAMAVMMLEEQGNISYDDEIIKYFPELSHYADSVTIRHLLNHTSGLPNYFEIVEDAIGITNEKVLNILTNQIEMRSMPGEMYHYNNSNYVLLAILAERISNMDFHEYMTSKIFNPLGMKDTFVYYDKYIPRLKNRAYGYDFRDGAFQNFDYDRLTAGGGGIYSSINDLYKWDQALYTEKLVKKSTLQAAFTSGKLSNDEDAGYGFGWKMGKYRGLHFVTHTGSSRGFRTRIKRFPKQGFSVILLCNFCQAEREILDKIAEIYLEDIMDRNYYTHLHLAVENEQEELTEYLLNKGADLLIADRNNKTALDLAIESGNEQIVKMLISKLKEINFEKLTQYQEKLDRFLFRLFINGKQDGRKNIIKLISNN